ncbi:hypothetical protein AWENTII_002114 [Aspergillus wentii]|nr:hypothetical protein MW887_004690 [Aspergillus wentii]
MPEPVKDWEMYIKEFEAIPAGRIGQVEEIVDVIVFLVSPKISYMYGADLVVDGGEMHQNTMLINEDILFIGQVTADTN